MTCALTLQPLIVIIDPKQQDYIDLVAVADRSQIEIVFFASAQHALEAAPVSGAACWLINHHLSDGDGVEAYDALRHRIDGGAAFIVTDSYSSQDERVVLSRGRLHFLCKPLVTTQIQEICQIAARAANSGGGDGNSTDSASH